LLNNFNNKFSQQAIESVCLARTDLWMVKNFFEPAVLEDILNRLESETDWHLENGQEHLPRKVLRWTVGSLLWDIRGYLNTLDFSKFGLKFLNVSIWKDSAGFKILEHVDNDRVKAAMQIYLNDLPQNLGTWFEEVEVPFIKNTGYIMKNTNRPRHGMKATVPDATTRYSLYARFNLIDLQ
jgi:hypothetical protein